MSSQVSAQDVYRVYQCPHWPYWERFGDPADRRALSLEQEERLAGTLAHEGEIVARMFGASEDVTEATSETGFQATLDLMQAGVSVICHGWLLHDRWTARPHVLRRCAGASRFGAWMYTPVDVRRPHELRKEHKSRLALYAWLLERIQGAFPAQPCLVNADLECLTFETSEWLGELGLVMQRLERIVDGERPDPVYRKACEDTSPWGKACLRLAVERRDIALIFNIDQPRLQALRSAGIDTIDAAATLDVDALEGRSAGLTRTGLEVVRWQAQALRDRSVIIRTAPTLPAPDRHAIFFDIESHPATDRDYLYGIWQGDLIQGTYLAFEAPQAQAEEMMWRRFLAWLETLPAEYAVYHYASYEIERLQLMARRYGGADNPWLARFIERAVDLKAITRKHAIFPLYIYSLKYIAKFLGFRWEGLVQGGGQSVDVYEDWLKTGATHLWDELLCYNAGDVRATAFLLDWLCRYATDGARYAPPYPWETHV